MFVQVNHFDVHSDGCSQQFANPGVQVEGPVPNAAPSPVILLLVNFLEDARV